MRLARSLFAVASLLLAPLALHADTIDFSVTINKQSGLTGVPIGATYTGFAHYAGTWNPNSTGYPPVVDAFGFNYPSTPSTFSGFYDMFLQRDYIGGPLLLFFSYMDPSAPLASFDQNGDTFYIIQPTYVLTNGRGFGWSYDESGSVTYSYKSDSAVSDPVPPVSAPAPEPSTLALIGSLLPVAAAFGRRRLLSL